MVDVSVPGYQITGPLGRGGMAVVYRAVQNSLGRPVALKILPPHLAADPSFVGRFRREAATAARLHHPSIVAVYDFGQAGDTYYIAMQLVEGETLDVRLARGPVLPAEALSIVRQLAAALDYAHQHGVVHRDVKPSNIILRPDGSVLMMDFGIARATDSPLLTSVNAVIGTPAYMAPEQCRGLPVDGRADQYCLGVVLFEMLTGSPPFTGDPFAVYTQHINDPPPPLRAFYPGYPRLDKVVQHVLAKDPLQRYASSTDFVTALGEALVQKPSSVPPASGKISTQPKHSSVLKPQLRRQLALGTASLFLAVGAWILLSSQGVWIVILRLFGPGPGSGPGPPEGPTPPGPPAALVKAVDQFEADVTRILRGDRILYSKTSGNPSKLAVTLSSLGAQVSRLDKADTQSRALVERVRRQRDMLSFYSKLVAYEEESNNYFPRGWLSNSDRSKRRKLMEFELRISEIRKLFLDLGGQRLRKIQSRILVQEGSLKSYSNRNPEAIVLIARALKYDCGNKLALEWEVYFRKSRSNRGARR